MSLPPFDASRCDDSNELLLIFIRSLVAELFRFSHFFLKSDRTEPNRTVPVRFSFGFGSYPNRKKTAPNRPVRSFIYDFNSLCSSENVCLSFFSFFVFFFCSLANFVILFFFSFLDFDFFAL